MYGNMGEWWGYGMGFGLHWVFMVAFWGLLIWGAVFVFRLASRPPAAAESGSEPPAIAILKQRYARGELNREEFEAMQRELR
jgi:putative membrane protein